jgi:hypothetical protein
MDTSPTAEQWITADEVRAAKQRLIDAMAGFKTPVAYSVARRDSEGLTFAHVNDVGGTHELPAVVLATVCGYRHGNAALELTRDEFADAITLLAPAEACTAFEHPNLWSWRPLLEGSAPDAAFVAVFVGDLSAPSSSEAETALRQRLAAAPD